ncbi:hypothetical protein AAHA92_33863 [Salvia divinorum]|uniref:Uncharacterized protein n=1 Tax=Salvia divinorum TaxID=28513 RepID=A0ABD1FH16_SALDI
MLAEVVSAPFADGRYSSVAGSCLQSDSPLPSCRRFSDIGEGFILAEICEFCGLRGVEFLMKRPLSYLPGNYFSARL